MDNFKLFSYWLWGKILTSYGWKVPPCPDIFLEIMWESSSQIYERLGALMTIITGALYPICIAEAGRVCSDCQKGFWGLGFHYLLNSDCWEPISCQGLGWGRTYCRKCPPSGHFHWFRKHIPAAGQPLKEESAGYHQQVKKHERATFIGGGNTFRLLDNL